MQDSDIRVGGGLQLKPSETSIAGSYRDAGGSAPLQMDEGAGVMEADETIHDLQLGEGAEEVVYGNETEDGYDLVLPDVIEGTDIEQRVLDTYNAALNDEGSPLPGEVSEDDVRYMDSRIAVPPESSTVTFGEYETGFTMEGDGDAGRDDVSMELVNYLEIDPPEDATPVDLENFPAGDDHIHLDRIVYEVDLKTADAALYRSGEQIFEGDVDGMVSFMGSIEDHVDEDTAAGYVDLPEDEEEPAVPATVKVQESIAGSGLDLHEQVTDHLLGGEYLERVQ